MLMCSNRFDIFVDVNEDLLTDMASQRGNPDAKVCILWKSVVKINHDKSYFI